MLLNWTLVPIKLKQHPCLLSLLTDQYKSAQPKTIRKSSLVILVQMMYFISLKNSKFATFNSCLQSSLVKKETMV